MELREAQPAHWGSDMGQMNGDGNSFSDSPLFKGLMGGVAGAGQYLANQQNPQQPTDFIGMMNQRMNRPKPPKPPKPQGSVNPSPQPEPISPFYGPGDY